MAQLFIADLVLVLIEFLCILLVFQISEMHNSAQELQRTAYSKNNTNKKEVSITKAYFFFIKIIYLLQYQHQLSYLNK